MNCPCCRQATPNHDYRCPIYIAQGYMITKPQAGKKEIPTLEEFIKTFPVLSARDLFCRKCCVPTNPKYGYDFATHSFTVIFSCLCQNPLCYQQTATDFVDSGPITREDFIQRFRAADD